MPRLLVVLAILGFARSADAADDLSTYAAIPKSPVGWREADVELREGKKVIAITATAKDKTVITYTGVAIAMQFMTGGGSIVSFGVAQ